MSVITIIVGVFALITFLRFCFLCSEVNDLTLDVWALQNQAARLESRLVDLQTVSGASYVPNEEPEDSELFQAERQEARERLAVELQAYIARKRGAR